MTPQNTCNNINARLVSDDAIKNMDGSPFNPIVPGPVMSAKTLIRENAPDIIPNPNPETTNIKFILLALKKKF